ncbi:TRAM domain-containing protein [Candidatus Saccharibacteria bacterium]|nr:TRAM domain-containing protein [Candidatus Saccharibacteria bacterium]
MGVISFLFILGIFLETSYLSVREIARKTSRPRGRRKVFVDTSALMDGRILEVARTGFLSDDFLIPRSVTRELQLLADGKDSEKRTRARRGLEVINELERVVYINAEVFDDSELGKMLVDDRLIRLAKENKGVILSCDFNLKKVAETEGVETLNINDLAIVLSNKFQQGDKFRIKITEKGSNAGQGVGHLEDGTMVVVDGGDKFIGTEVEVKFLRFLQSSSGRIIFADGTNRRTSSTNQKRKRTRRG